MTQGQGPEKHCSDCKNNDSIISMNVSFLSSKEMYV